LLIVSVVLQLNIWNKNLGFYLQFISIFLALLVYTLLAFYFQKRAKIAYYRFINESKKQRIIGSLCVNGIILIIVTFFVMSVAKHR
jgi:hypothetical protein